MANNLSSDVIRRRVRNLNELALCIDTCNHLYFKGKGRSADFVLEGDDEKKAYFRILLGKILLNPEDLNRLFKECQLGDANQSDSSILKESMNGKVESRELVADLLGFDTGEIKKYIAASPRILDEAEWQNQRTNILWLTGNLFNPHTRQRISAGVISPDFPVDNHFPIRRQLWSSLWRFYLDLTKHVEEKKFYTWNAFLAQQANATNTIAIGISPNADSHTDKRNELLLTPKICETLTRNKEEIHNIVHQYNELCNKGTGEDKKSFLEEQFGSILRRIPSLSRDADKLNERIIQHFERHKHSPKIKMGVNHIRDKTDIELLIAEEIKRLLQGDISEPVEHFLLKSINYFWETTETLLTFEQALFLTVTIAEYFSAYGGNFIYAFPVDFSEFQMETLELLTTGVLAMCTQDALSIDEQYSWRLLIANRVLRHPMREYIQSKGKQLEKRIATLNKIADELNDTTNYAFKQTQLKSRNEKDLYFRLLLDRLISTKNDSRQRMKENILGEGRHPSFDIIQTPDWNKQRENIAYIVANFWSPQSPNRIFSEVIREGSTEDKELWKKIWHLYSDLTIFLKSTKQIYTWNELLATQAVTKNIIGIGWNIKQDGSIKADSQNDEIIMTSYVYNHLFSGEDRKTVQKEAEDYDSGEKQIDQIHNDIMAKFPECLNQFQSTFKEIANQHRKYRENAIFSKDTDSSFKQKAEEIYEQAKEAIKQAKDKQDDELQLGKFVLIAQKYIHRRTDLYVCLECAFLFTVALVKYYGIPWNGNPWKARYFYSFPISVPQANTCLISVCTKSQLHREEQKAFVDIADKILLTPMVYDLLEEEAREQWQRLLQGVAHEMGHTLVAIEMLRENVPDESIRNSTKPAIDYLKLLVGAFGTKRADEADLLEEHSPNIIKSIGQLWNIAANIGVDVSGREVAVGWATHFANRTFANPGFFAVNLRGKNLPPPDKVNRERWLRRLGVEIILVTLLSNMMQHFINVIAEDIYWKDLGDEEKPKLTIMTETQLEEVCGLFHVELGDRFLCVENFGTKFILPRQSSSLMGTGRVVQAVLDNFPWEGRKGQILIPGEYNRDRRHPDSGRSPYVFQLEWPSDAWEDYNV